MRKIPVNWYRSPARDLPEPRVWTSREAKRVNDHFKSAVLVDLFITPVTGGPVHPYRWTTPYAGENRQTYLLRQLGYVYGMNCRVKFPELEEERSPAPEPEAA